MPDPYPFLITVPHGGLEVPDEVAELLALPAGEIARLSDPATCAIYDFGDAVAAHIKVKVSRIVVDVNRPPYHLPPRHPDGVIKTRTPQGHPVYRNGGAPPIGVIHALMLRQYFPFHEAVDRLLDEHHVRCAFDCHSMEAIGPRLARDAGRSRPLICLGNHGNRNGEARRGRLATCPAAWIRALAARFGEQFPGGEVALNSPFRGGFTPMAHYWHRGVPWISIELNRGLYEDGDGVVDEGTVDDLRKRCWAAFSGFWEDVERGDRPHRGRSDRPAAR